MQKIIYSDTLAPRWSEWGISLPLKDDRSRRIMEALKNINYPIYPTDLSFKVSREDLLKVHQDRFVNMLFSRKCEEQIFEAFELDNKRYFPNLAKYPLSSLFENILEQASMSVQAMLEAYRNGDWTFFLGGGMHHARYHAGGGFCLINDLVLGAKILQNQMGVKSVWIIDVDAHFGDGTADIASRFSEIKTFSIHMKEGWPFDGEKKFIPSDLDIPMAIGEEPFYLDRLEQGLLRMEKNYFLPDFAIINLGADPYENDELESSQGLKLSKEQLLGRDIFIESFFQKRKIPRTYLMSGGYGESSWEIYYQFLRYLIKEDRAHGGESAF